MVMAMRAMVMVTATATTWGQATKSATVRAARAMVMVMSVAGGKEGKGGKVTVMVTRMVGK